MPACSSHKMGEFMYIPSITAKQSAGLDCAHTFHFESHFSPIFFFLVEKWLQSYFKIWPVVLPSLNVTVTRKRGLNLSNGSSPVLRPLRLAIQSICQAGGTLWLWGTGTGGDEWEISSAATPFPWSWLTLLVTGSVSILASQLFRSSPCSPGPVRCVIPELSFYKGKRKRNKEKIPL